MIKNPFKKKSTLVILAILVLFSTVASILIPFIEDELVRKIADKVRWMLYGLLVGFFISRDFRGGKNERGNNGEA